MLIDPYVWKLPLRLTVRPTSLVAWEVTTVGFNAGLGIGVLDDGPSSSGSKGKLRSLRVSSREPSTRYRVTL